MAYHKFTTNYFNSRKPAAWDFSGFLAEFTQQYPAVRLDDAKSRFLSALQKIVASAPSPSARSKAQSLIDTLKSKGLQKKRPNQTDNLVINGGISIAPRGQIINTGGGDVSITGEGPAKKRRLEPTPAADEDKQNEEGSDDEEGNVNGEDENGEGEENGEDDENVQDDGNRDISHDDNSGTAATPSPCNDRFHPFLVTFLAMKNKRRFTSGRILEDIIHLRVTENPSSAGEAIHWIIDLSDSTVRSWFTKEECSELLGWVPPTPQVDEYFTYAKRRYYNKSTVLDIREVAESKPTPPGVRYDRETNFNATYVNSAAGAILSMIEQSNSNESFGAQGHKEGWYGSKLWSTILDHCMDDMDNFTVSRTEIRSKSGYPNKRFDAIFLGHAGVEIAEFGAVEVARTADVLASGKRACDEEKLRGVMAAMLKVLLAHVNHDAETAKLLQVVGVQQVGFNIRISTMCSVSKGVFLLKRGLWRKVPNKLVNFYSVFDVMQSVVVMKKIIQRTVETIKRYYDKNAERAEGFEL